MMKWIFSLLILVNAVFFTVMQWGGSLTADNIPPTQAPLNADKIKIVTILPASSPASAVEAAVAVSSVINVASSPLVPTVVPIKTTVRMSCMEWGEFSGADLLRAEKLLEEMKLGDKLKQRTVDYISGYWVYIPPLKTAAQIKKKIAQLKKFEVDDYFVMKEAGTWKNAISLGLFKTEDSAKKYLAKLRKKG